MAQSPSSGLAILLLDRRRPRCWPGPARGEHRSGVRVRTIEAGAGPVITAEDGVLIEYEGRLDDGTVFDTSAGRGPAFSLIGGRSFPASPRRCTKMQKGGRYKIHHPVRARLWRNPPPGSPIPPNADLDFDVHVAGGGADGCRSMRGAQGAGAGAVSRGSTGSGGLRAIVSGVAAYRLSSMQRHLQGGEDRIGEQQPQDPEQGAHQTAAAASTMAGARSTVRRAM